MLPKSCHAAILDESIPHKNIRIISRPFGKRKLTNCKPIRTTKDSRCLSTKKYLTHPMFHVPWANVE